MPTLKDSYLAPSPAQPTSTVQTRTQCPQSVIPGSAVDAPMANPGADSGNPIGTKTQGPPQFRVTGG